MEKPKIFLRSLLLSYLLSGILLVAISFALYKLRLKESQVRLFVNLTYVASCAFGGFLAGKGLGKSRFFCGLLTGLLYFILLLAVSFLLNKGITASMEQLLMTGVLCIGGGIAGGVRS